MKKEQVLNELGEIAKLLDIELDYVVVDYGTLLGKMIKLEQGSDSNE